MLLGFDLDAEEAGGTGDNPTDPPGWFFVLKKRPGEPRFGFDDARAADDQIETVNDLAWSDAGVAPGHSLKAATLAAITLAAPGVDDQERKDQHDDDVKVVPAAVSAARWAYVLYRLRDGHARQSSSDGPVGRTMPGRRPARPVSCTDRSAEAARRKADSLSGHQQDDPHLAAAARLAKERPTPLGVCAAKHSPASRPL
jgi:hypothetical protein